MAEEARGQAAAQMTEIRIVDAWIGRKSLQ
jgi:hypothetical protein